MARLRSLMSFIGDAATAVFPGRSPFEPLGPVPESTKALTRERPFIVQPARSPFPLVGADGRTWAQRKADTQ